MKDTAFQELLTSIRQAGKVRRGMMKPVRVTTFRPADVKSVREKLKASQAEFALMIGVSVAKAFTLVGALSIVRVRTVVDDTRDTAFVIYAVVRNAVTILQLVGPALALLRVAARNPRAVAEALHREPRTGAA